MPRPFQAPGSVHLEQAGTKPHQRARTPRVPIAPLPRLTVSLKTLAAMLDAHRSSVRRWLTEAGVHPIVVGRGRNAGIRYRWPDIERWLNSREEID